MPICEHSDAWGYNPRQLMAVHGAYGTPDELRALIRRAHELGMAVIIDVVRPPPPAAYMCSSAALCGPHLHGLSACPVDEPCPVCAHEHAP